MKKILVTLVMLSILIVSGCSAEKEVRDYEAVTTETKIRTDDDINFSATVAERILESKYRLDGVKIDFMDKNYRIYPMSDDKNAKTGEVYKNLYSAFGDFTFQDRKNSFQLLYSLTDAEHYKTIYFYTPFNKDITISLPLENNT